MYLEIIITYLTSCTIGVLSDIYLHSPRGSNDRLNEPTATRTNAQRLFNSQNNNRGGYNVGDATATAAGTNETNQYRMKHFMSGPKYLTLGNGGGSTLLTFEWTDQHGCGGLADNDPVNCNIVLQYMCQNDVPDVVGPIALKDKIMRNGVTTTQQTFTKPVFLNETELDMANRRNVVQTMLGLHEPWDWYNKCYLRERNAGLFVADQKLTANNGLGYSSAIYTRQNAAGTQYGYECPEERDYYPYWHPTPWKDMAILAVNASVCSQYVSNSFNVQPYSECLEYYPSGNRKPQSRWNNQTACQTNGGYWATLNNYLELAPKYTSEAACNAASGNGINYIWAVPYDSPNGKNKQCLVALSPPDCIPASWTRSNHLGNALNGEPNNYTWTIPYFPSGNTQRCVARIRYNISTTDYDPYNTDSSDNGNQSPIKTDPKVDIGMGLGSLQLDIDTNQLGRTFQDRTHVFLLQARPQQLNDYRMYNLNVRGKRGNIVQAYPAVEYDFFPTTLYFTSNDLLHIQWTGSNTHNNGGNGGDGQAGDTGEGTGGTDRSNMVQILGPNHNFPVPFEMSSLWNNSQIKWIYHGKLNVQPQDLALTMASSGYYACLYARDCPGMMNVTIDTKAAMDNLLNNAPASFAGVVLQLSRGTYYYTCSRNNNFSNRSQKGTLIVS